MEREAGLVIVGNGFDRFHGIESSYWHFKEYLKRIGAWGFIDSLEKYIDSNELWSSFEYALGCLDYESIEENNSCYMLSYSDDNWTDSAHHDYQYMIQKELSFSEKISTYLHQWILSLKTKRRNILSTEVMSNNNTFINFNYTDTLEATYGISRNNICYIHGKAFETEKLIVGHGNKKLTEETIQKEFSSEEESNAYSEYLSGFDVRELEGQEIIRGYFCDTYKDVNKIMMHNQKVFASYRGVSKVYVLGHSLAHVDLPYIRYLNDILGQGVTWIVSYHEHQEKIQHAKQLMSIGVLGRQILTCKMEQLCG